MARNADQRRTGEDLVETDRLEWDVTSSVADRGVSCIVTSEAICYPSTVAIGSSNNVSEHSFVPRTLGEAIPFIVWIVLIVAAGHSGIATLVHAEWWPCIASFGILAGLTVAFIYWRQITKWGPLAYALATLLIGVSVWSSPVWDRLLPSLPPTSNGSPDQTQFAAVQQERDQLRARVQILEAQLAAIRGQSRIRTEHGPIIWDRLLLKAAAPRLIKGVEFGGESVSSVTIKDAYAVSDMTGDKIPFSILTPENDQIVPLDKINEIPAGATIDLRADLSQPLSAAEFLDKWGKVTVEVAYGDGHYSRSFDEAYMRQQVALLVPGAAQPRVTPRRD